MSPTLASPMGREDVVADVNSTNLPAHEIPRNNNEVINKDLQFQDEGQYTKEDRGFLSLLSPVTLGIVCACALAIVLLCVAALLWLRSRRRRRKLLHDLTFDDCSDEYKSTKSAPASRTTSPKPNKRLSCPDALSVTPARSVLVRSLTSDRDVLDLALTQERVQPRDPPERRGSGSLSTQKANDNREDSTPDQQTRQSTSDDDELNLPEAPHGRLWYSVVYNGPEEQLQVNLVKVKNLPGRNTSLQPRDPFVKMFLLPDERTCRISKVKKNTLSPVFNEVHTFQVADEDVKKRILRFSVYDVDKRRVRHSLGHVLINMKSLDLTKGEVTCSDLEPMVQATTSLGEIQFSLIYAPSVQKVKVVLHQARNLNYLEDYPDMDIYVRVQLFYGHRCHRIKRTITHPGGRDLAFNESLSFTVNGKQMDSCNLAISVMLTSPNVYTAAEIEHGRVVVGPFMYSRGDQLVHWQEMMSKPKLPSLRWHSLTNISSSP